MHGTAPQGDPQDAAPLRANKPRNVGNAAQHGRHKHCRRPPHNRGVRLFEKSPQSTCPAMQAKTQSPLHEKRDARSTQECTKQKHMDTQEADTSVDARRTIVFDLFELSRSISPFALPTSGPARPGAAGATERARHLSRAHGPNRAPSTTPDCKEPCAMWKQPRRASVTLGHRGDPPASPLRARSARRTPTPRYEGLGGHRPYLPASRPDSAEMGRNRWNSAEFGRTRP